MAGSEAESEQRDKPRLTVKVGLSDIAMAGTFLIGLKEIIHSAVAGTRGNEVEQQARAKKGVLFLIGSAGLAWRR